MFNRSRASQLGFFNSFSGRFAQISGLRLVWDPSGTPQQLDEDENVVTPGTRVVDITLDNGQPIVSNGQLVAGAPALNIATIDFLARGGDQYPYRGASFVSLGVTYQHALANYITNGLGGVVSAAQYPDGGEGRISQGSGPGPTPDQVRFATFNASLNRNNEGDLITDLSTPDNAQAKTIAEIIQRTAPDVLLINEFDFDAAGEAGRLFQQNYLAISQNGAPPLEYPFWFSAPSNTGMQSGFDFNNDGSPGGPDDAFGFGFFPGQFGMIVYSQFPFDEANMRTFLNFLWEDMPGALLPDDPTTPAPQDWYSPQDLAVFRLSSKSHWDIPVNIGGKTVHVLVSHPTPPVFDGPEDRNGRRNHDEIRLWADYITPGQGDYIYDDNGTLGGLAAGESFVIMGDQNADPLDGDSVPGAIQQLIESPFVNASNIPRSAGGSEQSELQGGANLLHLTDPASDTADFADDAPGNLRADYVLPSFDLQIVDSAVFWPTRSDSLFSLVGTFPFPSSDHRLVWVDVTVAK